MLGASVDLCVLLNHTAPLAAFKMAAPWRNRPLFFHQH